MRGPGILDLPGEVIGVIASYLSLDEILRFHSLHPVLLSVLRSTYTPLPHAISSLLAHGPPYPSLLAKLPSLNYFLPPDPGPIFIDLLTRARPRWIIERLELGRWPEPVWREAYERRFLPSWKRFKGLDDTWRATFLRMLGRLEHRNLGCTHEESWTRFITLHRNGSGSINRIYSRLFDPFEIYDELKHQNNFAAYPTQVRVILHLQDVRIIALGVSIDKSSLFVNPNAHLVLHPPLLRGVGQTDGPFFSNQNNYGRSEAQSGRPRSTTTPSSMAGSAEIYYPLVRSISPHGATNTSYGLSDGPMPAALSVSGPSQAPPAKRSLTRVMPRSRRIASWNGSIEETDEAGSSSSPPTSSRIGGMLSLNRTRSREKSPHSDQPRRGWSFTRPRASSDGYVITAEAMGVPPIPTSHAPITPAMPTVTELDNPDSSPSPDHTGTARPLPPTPPKTPVPSSSARLPYAPLRKPMPAKAFRLYPNYTPIPVLDPIQGMNGCPASGIGDTRQSYTEIEDDLHIYSWGGEDSVAWDRMAEYDPATGVRRRWVGPMVLFAQLFPSDRTSPHPPGVDQSTPVEGPGVELGPKGMYASLGFEDLDRLLPWVELKGGGGNSAEPRRAGLGFDDVATMD